MLYDESGFQDRCPNEKLIFLVLLFELGKERLAGGMREAAGDKGEEAQEGQVSKSGGMLTY